MKLWREEQPVLNDKNIITMGGMWKHQQDWWNSTNFIKALVTGYGGGKTFIAGKRAISLALHNAPKHNAGIICPHIIVSPSYKIARRTIIPTIRALLQGKAQLLPGFRWNFHKTEHEFTIMYKGRCGVIWIASGDDPDSLKGPNVGSATIDEPFIQSEEVLDQIVARVREPSARCMEIGLTGTPESLNWGYDICEGDRCEDFDIKVIHANTRANLALSNEYASRMESAYSELAAEAYVDGQFVNLQTGRVYYAFNKDRNVVDLPDPGGELKVGMDFNVDPMAAVVFWEHGNHMHYVDEIELPNSDTEALCYHLKEKYKDRDGKPRIRTVYPDASGGSRSTKSPGGKTDFHYIREANFEVDAPHANPGIFERENAVNGKLKARDGSVTLTVSPNCKKLIGYFQKYNHAEKNKQKQMSHLLDAAGYPVHRLFAVTRLSSPIKRIQGA